MGSLHVSQLGKAYKQYGTPWSRLLEWVLPFLGARHALKSVLRDINFSVAPGEAVGIIGVNGAGKSTLLKLITGTTQPTFGSVHSTGRMAALLELGIGFHPEFSGRENILMSAQLMGLSIDEQRALMPQIEAFAEIGEYIDAPLRVYSSGMQMRLAFSVATCVRPDILIVDEALAVGDVFFQQKCFHRIRAFTQAGTTLLFVSHSTATILNICTRCIYIHQGAVAFDGAPKDAIDLYQAQILNRLEQHGEPVQSKTGATLNDLTLQGQDELLRAPRLEGKIGSISTEYADCVGVRFVQEDGSTRNSIVADELVTLQIDFRIRRTLNDPHAGFKIRNRYGVVMFETNSYCMRKPLGPADVGSILSVRFSFVFSLFPDEYTITAGLGNEGYGEGSFNQVISYLHEVTAFVAMPNPGAINWQGMANLQPQINVRKYQ